MSLFWKDYLYNVVFNSWQDATLVLFYWLLARVEHGPKTGGMGEEIKDAGFQLVRQEMFERYLRPNAK